MNVMLCIQVFCLPIWLAIRENNDSLWPIALYMALNNLRESDHDECGYFDLHYLHKYSALGC